MTDGERSQKIAQGIRVLRRREIEEYLYDPEVLRTFLETAGCGDGVVEDVLHERESLVNGHAGPNNVKDVSRELFRENPRRHGAAEPREQPGRVRVAVPGSGARRNALRVRGTPGRCVRQRLTLEVAKSRARLTHRDGDSGPSRLTSAVVVEASGVVDMAHLSMRM